MSVWVVPAKEKRRNWTYEECKSGHEAGNAETFTPGHSFDSQHGYKHHVFCSWCGAPNPAAPVEERVAGLMTQ